MCASPTDCNASAEVSSADLLVHEVVARVLQQQRDPAGALDPPACRFQQTGGVTQERGLTCAVAAHQRDGLAGMQGQLDATQDRRTVAQLVPNAAHLQRRGGLARTPLTWHSRSGLGHIVTILGQQSARP